MCFLSGRLEVECIAGHGLHPGVRENHGLGLGKAAEMCQKRGKLHGRADGHLWCRGKVPFNMYVV